MRKNKSAESPDCLCITAAAVSRMLGVSRSTVYEMCRLKQLPVIKCGERRLMILKVPFMRMISRENEKLGLDKAEQGEVWDKTDQVVPVEVKKPLDKVIPARLPGDKWEELSQEATELGIEPTTLAHMWILERLRGKGSK